jgi:hypothetical protein
VSAHSSRPRSHRRNPAWAFLAIAAVFNLGLVASAASAASSSLAGASGAGWNFFFFAAQPASTAPETTIDSGPSGQTNDASP